MEGIYGVQFGSKQVGKVQVIRQGLYYRFICRCILTGDILCRLEAFCGSRRANLGIVVPIEDGFGLDTKLPAKQLGEGNFSFLLVPKHNKTEGKFVPIAPEEPFAYLSRLKESFLYRKEGQAGILLGE